MQKQESGWHVAKTAINLDRLNIMIEETRSAIYGVFPHGYFAKLVSLPNDEATALGLPTTTQLLPRHLHHKVGCQRCRLARLPLPTSQYLSNSGVRHHRVHRRFSRGIHHL